MAAVRACIACPLATAVLRLTKRKTMSAGPVFWLGIVPLRRLPVIDSGFCRRGPPHSVGHATEFNRVPDSPASAGTRQRCDLIVKLERRQCH
ncbi:hypothetical protein MPLB_1700107 [Mesorhizobium sp. ORS 3324]|nr:hypothetical protein MPLB_1700107 [Mesorhizobium sp. ORS 3324]